MEQQLEALRRKALPVLGVIALALGLIVVGWQWLMIAQRVIRLTTVG